jgi:hypothetical protein
MLCNSDNRLEVGDKGEEPTCDFIALYLFPTTTRELSGWISSLEPNSSGFSRHHQKAKTRDILVTCADALFGLDGFLARLFLAFVGHVRGPQCPIAKELAYSNCQTSAVLQVVPEQLPFDQKVSRSKERKGQDIHDEGRILVRLLGQGVELGDGVVKGLLGELASLVGRVEDLVVKDGKVQGQAEADGVRGGCEGVKSEKKSKR